jgi:hypothetical protein
MSNYERESLVAEATLAADLRVGSEGLARGVVRDPHLSG